MCKQNNMQNIFAGITLIFLTTLWQSLKIRLLQGVIFWCEKIFLIKIFMSKILIKKLYDYLKTWNFIKSAPTINEKLKSIIIENNLNIIEWSLSLNDHLFSLKKLLNYFPILTCFAIKRFRKFIFYTKRKFNCFYFEFDQVQDDLDDIASDTHSNY